MIKIYIFFFILTSVFSYGFIVGYYEVFPFEQIKNLKSIIVNDLENEQTDITIYEDDLDSIININSENDLLLKKTHLINFIWKDTLPYSSPISISENINDERYQDISNLKTIHKLTINMEYGVNSIAYLFLSETSNNKLIIYHQGHTGDFIAGKETINFFLDEGYSVLAFSMPLLGMSNQPVVDLENFGKIKLTTHDHLIFLESSSFSPIKFFIEPIGTSLTYLDKNYSFDSYYMLGISGGGWTTVMFGAVDDRILQSYSVAGTLPMFMRSDSKNLGDYEQIVPELYRIANYLELYILSSYGDNRTHIQIFNKNDPCCFSGNISGIYDYEINNKLEQLGKGEFFLYVDDTHKKHEISKHSRSLILKHMSSLT